MSNERLHSCNPRFELCCNYCMFLFLPSVIEAIVVTVYRKTLVANVIIFVSAVIQTFLAIYAGLRLIYNRDSDESTLEYDGVCEDCVNRVAMIPQSYALATIPVWCLTNMILIVANDQRMPMVIYVSVFIPLLALLVGMIIGTLIRCISLRRQSDISA